MPNHTRKTSYKRRGAQRGGFFTAADEERVRTTLASKSADMRSQITHCLSQLKRFAPCISEKPIRAYQFFYNLGRLQELLGETTYPAIWWTPMESLITAEKYADLVAHVDRLQTFLGLDYDAELIRKGC